MPESHNGLKFDNLNPGLDSAIFKCISWINGSFLGRFKRVFLKERRVSNGTNVASELAKLILRLHIYSLWLLPRR
jgi:hypothetical protein